MVKIIISYRRSDSDVFAGRVHDRIRGHYGDDSTFIDVDNIPFGTDFRVHIQKELASANAVLVIVGPRWLGTNKSGHSRIMDATDPVRIEVETALSKGIATIPILVGKTQMPKPEQLPESLKDFAFINAAPVDTSRDFHRDLNRVIAAIDDILRSRLKNTAEEEQAAAIRTSEVKAQADEGQSTDGSGLAEGAEGAPRRDEEKIELEPQARVSPPQPESRAGEERGSATAAAGPDAGEQGEAPGAPPVGDDRPAAPGVAAIGGNVPSNVATAQAIEEDPRGVARAPERPAEGRPIETNNGAVAGTSAESVLTTSAANPQPASVGEPASRQSRPRLLRWSYPMAAIVFAVLGWLAGLMGLAGLNGIIFGRTYLLSGARVFAAIVVTLLVASLTSTRRIAKWVAALFGLYGIFLASDALMFSTLFSVSGTPARSLVLVSFSAASKAIVWLFVAAVFLPFGNAVRDYKMLGIAAAAGAAQGVWFAYLAFVLLVSTALALPIFSFAITAVVLTYGIRRQLSKGA
jgi:TIR domain